MTFLEAFLSRRKTNNKVLMERLDTLESQIKLLRLEWTEVYDKVTHSIERWSKRQKALVSEKTETEEVLPDPLNGRVYTDAQLLEMARKRGMLG